VICGTGRQRSRLNVNGTCPVEGIAGTWYQVKGMPHSCLSAGWRGRTALTGSGPVRRP
jgi:hypothetical protein